MEFENQNLNPDRKLLQIPVPFLVQSFKDLDEWQNSSDTDVV